MTLRELGEHIEQYFIEIIRERRKAPLDSFVKGLLFIASRFENMWVPLGIGVAGFLSGMALGTSKISLFLTDPFVVILKPAVSMSAEPDVSVMVIAIIETLLFLLAGLWMSAHTHYE